MNRLIYTLLLHLGLPLVGIRLLVRARKAPAYARRTGERFALGLPAFRPGGIWVHAVSVGESIAAAPMIRALMARHPDLPITVTCMTPTGSERIRALFHERIDGRGVALATYLELVELTASVEQTRGRADNL